MYLILKGNKIVFFLIMNSLAYRYKMETVYATKNNIFTLKRSIEHTLLWIFMYYRITAELKYCNIELILPNIIMFS